MIEFLGIIGGLCFAVSGIPTVIAVVKAGYNFMPIKTAYLVFIGAISTFIYLFVKNGFDLIILIDYLITIASWGIILVYNYFPRKKKD